MASTARHRAHTAPLTWAARSLVTATTVPVGALAGCVVAAVAATAQNPGLGIAGLAAAGLPLTLRGLRARRSSRHVAGRGRHVAGRGQLDALGAMALSQAAPAALEPLQVRLDPAVDPAEPSPAAASALSLVPVGTARTAPAHRAETGVVVAIPAPRSTADADADAAPVTAEVVVRVGTRSADLTVSVEVPAASVVAPEQRAAEIAQLNCLWAAGTGPDTGSMRTTSAAA